MYGCDCQSEEEHTSKMGPPDMTKVKCKHGKLCKQKYWPMSAHNDKCYEEANEDFCKAWDKAIIECYGSHERYRKFNEQMWKMTSECIEDLRKMMPLKEMVK